MANDRLNALYRAQIWEASTQRICRERIHWICSQVQGEDVLDLGCSEGMASLLLGQEGHQVVGVDINPAVVEVARQELLALPELVRQHVRFELIGAGRLPFDDASFDTVLMGEILEHQTRPERLLAEARRVLRPGGVAVVTSPFGVHRDEEHKQTFYLSDFVELITRFFHTEHLHTLGKYICYVGSVARDNGVSENGVVEPQRLLRLSEETFERAEDTYLERLDRTRGELNALKQKLTQLQAADDAERKERAALAAKLMVAQRWYNGSLQLMSELRTLLNRNGTLGDVSHLAARTERILSTANGQVDAAHALDMLAEVVRDLVGNLEAQLVARERELVRVREAQQIELTRAREQAEQQRRTEIERVRRELETAAQQQLAAADLQVNRAGENQLAAIGRTLRQKEAQLNRVVRTAADLRQRLARHKNLLSFFKAELALKRQEVRYRLGDALVRAGEHPRDLFLLPGRLVGLFFEGLRRTRARRPGGPAPLPANAPPLPAESPAAPSTSATAPPPAGRGTAAHTRAAPQKPPQPPAARPAPAAADVKLEFRVVTAADRAPRLPMKVAAVMDEFTQACFKPECQLLLVKPDNWKQVLAAERPEFLFLESAWNGNDGAWRYQLALPRKIESGPLWEMIQWCRSQKIPTVFWNKEDPPNFDQFINAAGLCDHVFTTDENCIPEYRRRLGHERIHALPFAAQEAIHNPVGTHRELVGNVCFAGAYYAKRHEERQGDMDLLLKPALKQGLHIFDRMHGTTDERYRFPAEYAAAIRGSLPYAQMLDAYKRYRVFLNVNSVKDSPTMFSRRVLELLACGTPVISTYALGLERLLGPECVALVKAPEEAQQWLDLLLKNQEISDRMVLRAQRRIFSEHTYRQRLQTILETIGLPVPTRLRRVSVITCTNRPANIEKIIANYERQKHPDRELVLILNSDNFSLETVKERLANVANARAFQLPAERTLGACLNKALDEIRYEYWSKFDDDNFYGENFISDMLMPFLYSEASIVGKYTYYSYHDGPHCLALRYPGQEHRYVTLLSGSALIVDRAACQDVRFPDQNRGEDTQFLRECVSRGLKLYSADRFNYFVRRSARVEDHTWQITDAEFLRHCQIVAYTDDGRAHVTC